MGKKFDPDRFSVYLKEQAKIIRQQRFDYNQIQITFGSILSLIEIWKVCGNKACENTNNMAEAIFEFNLALNIAFSNYRTENKSMWTSIFGWTASKVPQIDLSKLLNTKN